MNFLRGQRMQRQNPRKLILRFALPAVLASLFLLAPTQTRAQATAARSREAGISGFVAYTRLNPDYGPSGNGVTLGADYMRLYKFVSPAIEVRFKDGSATAVSERTFGGGLRLEHQIGYFHPYADLLVSAGNISFANKNYIGASGTGSNNSVVYSFGGGVDYDFADQWAARVDYQQESWNLKGNPNLTLTPRAFSIGVMYRIRFRRDKF
jgi:hypothetical protein